MFGLSYLNMVKQSTFDLLDSELRQDYKNKYELPLDDQIKYFERTTVVNPRLWDLNKNEIMRHQYSWRTIKYTELHKEIKDQSSPMDDIGIYYFTVKPDLRVQDLPCFVVYVGIAGETDSQRTLRDRLSDYLRLSEIKKRANIHKIMQLYYENMYVNYSSLKGLSVLELKQLETVFHDFFYPWANSRDYSPQLKRARSAW